MSLPSFVPEGLPASLKIQGYPEVRFVLLSTNLVRPVYQVDTDERGFQIFEQDKNVTITLQVRSISIEKG